MLKSAQTTRASSMACSLIPTARSGATSSGPISAGVSVIFSSKPNITSIRYSLNALPAGATNTTSFNFESYNPDPSLTLNVDFLDAAAPEIPRGRSRVVDWMCVRSPPAPTRYASMWLLFAP